jgi:hypothetical protein
MRICRIWTDVLVLPPNHIGFFDIIYSICQFIPYDALRERHQARSNTTWGIRDIPARCRLYPYSPGHPLPGATSTGQQVVDLSLPEAAREYIGITDAKLNYPEIRDAIGPASRAAGIAPRSPVTKD